ncbi:MAG: FGGY-family carbohydrate kinase [Anaerolineae bacterium]|nr:FGGY-family carbohydrate kinase [Anaerolineae bacterium]MDW8071406.1 FGGY-family carbohydrate kinase [Anaerolineae bacterium]
MKPYILAWDLGTSGCKTTLFDSEGNCRASCLVPYATKYPTSGWHEQRPMDWWHALVTSTRQLLATSHIPRDAIACCGISGHSLGVVPLDRKGALLREYVPIWSDARASAQAERFFCAVDEVEWYRKTGNGFPPPLYAVFKIMWYRDHEPDMFRQIDKVIGTKDFINFKLTGQIVTDHSYASGSGVYDLLQGGYSEALITASGLPREIFPDIVPSTEVIGELRAEAAEALGLPRDVKVVAGGVDNSCMALGARNIQPGRVYNSLGSSSWIAVSAAQPLLDDAARPYVFAHVIPGMFTSAVSIFSAGSSFRWVRDQLCQNLVAQAAQQQVSAYELMTALAAESPVGANRLLFNPSLGGGTALEGGQNIRGAYIGLDLRHTQADLIRAAMEGIALGLRRALDVLRRLTRLEDEMLIVGGGSRSALWRQICADVYNMTLVKTQIDQEAAALGAAAVAAVGTGLWRDFSQIDVIHKIEHVTRPIPHHAAIYERLLPIFIRAAQHQAELGEMLAALEL